MTAASIATALKRVEAVLARRPDAAIHDDAPATARWHGGTRIVASHADGTRVETDMPVEFGGSGDRVSPGWLFRAGVASCAATSITLHAAAEGIAIDALEVFVASRSDARGMLAMNGADGTPAPARPLGVELVVRIAAAGASEERLRELVTAACRRSPVPDAVCHAVPLAVSVEVGMPAGRR